MSYANNNVMSLLILPITNKKRWPLDLQLFFHCASFMTFLHFSCQTLTNKNLHNLVQVFDFTKKTGSFSLYQFWGNMFIKVEKSKALTASFDQKKQIATKFFKNASSIHFRNAADFSYCSHNIDFLSLGLLKIFRSTCVRVYAGTTKFPPSCIVLLNQPQDIKLDVI